MSGLSKFLAIFGIAFATISATDPILVPEVSQREINIQYGFTGADLLLFGAIIDPDGERAGRKSDIVVVLKGPVQSITVREKDKVAGIWVNAESTQFRSAPAFFAVASSRPVAQMVDEKTAAIYELGLEYLQLSPTGTIDPAEQLRFTRGLVDLRVRNDLYSEQPSAVSITEKVLYQARISIPASVPVGTYTAETFVIQNGKVLAAENREIEIRKYGFELFIATMAEQQSLLYGLVAVLVSVLLGWLAGRLFRKV